MLNFAAPNNARLVPGTYTGATRWPFQAPGVPGLDVDGEGRGSNTLTGQFTVTQAVYGASGNIVSFAASFEQRLARGEPAADRPGRVQLYEQSAHRLAPE